MYATVRAVALTRTPGNRKAAMRRQAERNRDVQTYGCPMHVVPDAPIPSTVALRTRKAHRQAHLAKLEAAYRACGGLASRVQAKA
jgi:hypothetical protein